VVEEIPDEPTASPVVETKPPITPVPTVETASSSPTLSIVGPETVAGLTTTLVGVAAIEDERQWESTTRSFWEDVYEESSDISRVKVEITVTSTKSNASRRRSLGVRGLQSDSSVEVTYTQTTSYWPASADVEQPSWDEIVKLPLSTQPNRDAYVGELKRLDGYEELTDVTEIAITDDSDGGDNVKDPDDPTSGGGLSLGAIIGIAVGGAVLLFLIAGLGYYKYKKGSEEDGGDPGTTTVGSTQAPTASGAGTGASLPTYGDTSVATVDYDYSRAFGGAGENSVSLADGTLGEGTRQTTGAESDPAMVPGSGNTIFSDDPTFDQAYEDVREEIIDVYAPAGKLGVVIDTPDDGAPVVHAVKDTSPICDKVQVGDKLVAVDDEDVRAMTAIKVSKLISRKSNESSRKLTIIRHVANN
jgi:hypothetical protein